MIFHFVVYALTHGMLSNYSHSFYIHFPSIILNLDNQNYIDQEGTIEKKNVRSNNKHQLDDGVSYELS